MSKRRTVLHRGSIPGTSIGDRWFEVNGTRYGVVGGPGPDRKNAGWAYEIVDDEYRQVDDSCLSLDDVRKWAEAQAAWEASQRDLTRRDLEVIRDSLARRLADDIDDDEGVTFDEYEAVFDKVRGMLS